MKENFLEYIEKFEGIRECIVDYSGPIYIVGITSEIAQYDANIISATIPKNELIILNNKYPNWLIEVINKKNQNNNMLIIKDFDKISIENQKLFVDIICKNYISSKKLPNNLKILINAEKKCSLIPEIEEVVQYFEM